MASVITTNTDKIAKPTNQLANAVSGVKGSNEAEYHTGLVNITPSSIGLGNVDNTSDADKPISTAVQTALEGKQNTISDLETIRANAGAGASAYQKPGTGIPSSDMSSAVQTSLGKADSAYAALGDKADKVFTVTITSTTSNNVTTYSSNKTVAEILAAYQSGRQVIAVHNNEEYGIYTLTAVTDIGALFEGTLASGNQMASFEITGSGVTFTVSELQSELVSGTNIKTINNTSLLGSGNIAIPKGDKGDKGDQGNSGYTGAVGELEVVNNLTDGGATAALSAEQGKLLHDNLILIYDALSENAFWSGKPALNWGSESCTIVNNLENVTTSNNATSANIGASYSATLSYDTTSYNRMDVSVMMCGVDVTSSVYNSSTGEISIDNVFGPVVITASATTQVTLYADKMIDGTNGNMVDATGKTCTDFIPCTACKLVWSAGAESSGSNKYNLAFYDSSKGFIDYYGSAANYRIIDLTSWPTIAYIRITFKSDKISTRMCYDITNNEYLFTGSSYDGRLDGFEWGKYVSPSSSTSENKQSDNSWALTPFIQLTSGTIKFYAGSNNANYKLALYDENKVYKDYYGHQPDPRSITNNNFGTTWKYARNSVPLSAIDDIYVLNETTNTYLFKGFNVT